VILADVEADAKDARLLKGDARIHEGEQQHRQNLISREHDGDRGQACTP
jgi:hypothetical protein